MNKRRQRQIENAIKVTQNDMYIFARDIQAYYLQYHIQEYTSSSDKTKYYDEQSAWKVANSKPSIAAILAALYMHEIDTRTYLLTEKQEKIYDMNYRVMNDKEAAVAYCAKTLCSAIYDFMYKERSSYQGPGFSLEERKNDECFFRLGDRKKA